MEFSFGTQEWLPKELLLEKQDGSESYALGLHAPGFFDKVLNVNKCLLQSEPANMVSYLIFFVLFCFFFVCCNIRGLYALPPDTLNWTCDLYSK